MATSIRFRDAFNTLLASGFITTRDGTKITPRFGDYLDSIAGETPVFMTIGVDPAPVRAFSSDTNDPISVSDDGYMTLVDTNGQSLSFIAVPLPVPAVTSSCWPTNGDQFEP